MRALGLIVAATLAWPAGQALAAANVSVRTTHYEINGASGEALVADMERRGPRHGLMTRAIAQTKYSMTSDAVWTYASGQCRATTSVVRLDVTYVYPRIGGRIPASLDRRWKRFMSGVARHEQTHGEIARQMAVAASRAIDRLRIADRPGCPRSRRTLKAKVAAIVAAYERKQVQFDANEHRSGGRVNSLLSALRR